MRQESERALTTHQASRSPLSSRQRHPLPPASGHGKITHILPVHFSSFLRKKPTKGEEATEPLEPFNTLWHGRDRTLARIPAYGGMDKNESVIEPSIQWKRVRGRMEWHPENMFTPVRDYSFRPADHHYDQNYNGPITSDVPHTNCKGKLADIKYKSSRISTDGKRKRAASLPYEGKVYVSLMDDMYKMTPYNAHITGIGSNAAGAATADDDRDGDRGDRQQHGQDAQNERDAKRIVTKVERVETEQSKEARHRTYAYFKQQDDLDPWTHLALRSHYRDRHTRNNLMNIFLDTDKNYSISEGGMHIGDDTRYYLDHILAEGNPHKKKQRDRDKGGFALAAGVDGRRPAGGSHTSTFQIKREQGEGGIASGPGDGTGGDVGVDVGLGKPTKHSHAVHDTPDHTSLDQLKRVMDDALNLNTVVSRERIFDQLVGMPSYTKLNAMAIAYKDAHTRKDDARIDEIDRQLHRWIVEAFNNDICHITTGGMERYTRQLKGTDVKDLFRNMVLETLTKSLDGKTKKADLQSACKETTYGLRWSDSLYSKVIKEYCVGGKGGVWTLKTGNEEPNEEKQGVKEDHAKRAKK